MTAAARTNRAAPMTVARGGREGSPIPVTPTFTSRQAFGGKEARFGKAMSIGSNPLTREVRIGKQPTVSTPHLTNFTNPDRAAGMSRIKIDVPYTGKILQGNRKETTPQDRTGAEHMAPVRVNKVPATDREVQQSEARNLLAGKNAITLYERPKTVIPVKKEATPVIVSAPKTVKPVMRTIPSNEIAKSRKPEFIKASQPVVTKAPSLSEVGLKIVKSGKKTETTENPTKLEIPGPVASVVSPIEIPTNPLTQMRKTEAAAKEASLIHVRSALQTISQPVIPSRVEAPNIPDVVLLIIPEIVRPTITKPESNVKPTTKKLSPLEKIEERAARKNTPKAYETMIKLQQKKTEIATSIETPKAADKAMEKEVLEKYIERYLLTDVAKTAATPQDIEKIHQTKKKMVEYMTNSQKKDGGSQLDAQLLGDTGATTEQVALKKIEGLVKETKLAIQVAKLRGEDVTELEQKALLALHTKIQEAGLLAVFLKVKTNVTEEITGKTAEGTTENPQLAPIQKPEEEEAKKDEKVGIKRVLKIELDTFARRFRRVFMKMRARRAFEKAKERGLKQVTSSEIAQEIGTYQYQFTKSEPVRYTKRPDGSIVETLADLHASNHIVQSVDEAEALIDRKIEQYAPVRMTSKIKTQPRGLLDLIRVMGYPQELLELTKTPTPQITA